MALQAGDAPADGLGPRVLSGLVLASSALVFAYAGGFAFNFLVLAAAAVMAYEWERLCSGDAAPTRAARGGRLWLAVGVVYIAVPCIAIIWLRSDDTIGRETILWLFAVVWANDIGAFFVGRGLGGPRLAPRISPKKTWTGLAGGVICTAAVGAATAALLDLPDALRLALLSAALALVAHFGDLGESMVKRRFHAKHSSRLIPGHGGLLDRLDGLMAVVPAVAATTLLSGEGVLAWR